jgi:hypothetical protein
MSGMWPEGSGSIGFVCWPGVCFVRVLRFVGAFLIFFLVPVSPLPDAGEVVPMRFVGCVAQSLSMARIFWHEGGGVNG